MKAYISVSFKKRHSLEEPLHAITATLKQSDITPFIFVDAYKFNDQQEQAMMQQAMADIDRCDILIAEISDKAIGIGIEVGFAKAMGKPIIYVRNEHADHSTTASGISDFHVIYSDADDLQKQLVRVLSDVRLRFMFNT